MSIIMFLIVLNAYGKGISIPNLYALVVAILYVGDCILISQKK